MKNKWDAVSGDLDVAAILKLGMVRNGYECKISLFNTSSVLEIKIYEVFKGKD